MFVVTIDSHGATMVVGVYDTYDLAESAIDVARSTPITYMDGSKGKAGGSYDIQELVLNEEI